MRKAPKRIRRRPRPDPREPGPGASPEVRDTGQDCPYGPDFDPVEASKIARVIALIGVEGKSTPLVEPIGDHTSHTDFDRLLAAAGVLRFVRPVMESDWATIPADHELASYTLGARHVLVAAPSPKVRVRRPILVVMNHEMN